MLKSFLFFFFSLSLEHFASSWGCLFAFLLSFLLLLLSFFLLLYFLRLVLSFSLLLEDLSTSSISVVQGSTTLYFYYYAFVDEHRSHMYKKVKNFSFLTNQHLHYRHFSGQNLVITKNTNLRTDIATNLAVVSLLGKT